MGTGARARRGLVGRVVLPWALVWPALLGTFGAPAAAKDDLESLRAALAKASSSVDREALVRRVAAVGGEAAAATLAATLRSDEEVQVRVAAARALGFVAARNALDVLTDALVGGGPSAAREAVARALVERAGALPRLLDRLDAPRAPETEQVLTIEALGAFADPTSRAALFGRLQASSPAVREAAMRSLVRRADARDGTVATLGRMLGESRDLETTLAILDVIEPLLDPVLRPALTRLARSPHAGVAGPAARLLRGLARPPAPAPGNEPKPPRDRYAPAGRGPPPPPPQEPLPPLARTDLVYALDATGSTTSTLPGLVRRIVDETALLVRSGVSVRVGVVAYRGGHGAVARRSMDVLLPRFDLAQVEVFLRALDSSGVDDRGAPVAAALEVALDQMPWRPGARREVRLFADSACDDPATARATVSIHFRADGTRTHFAYMLRTRTRVPPEFAELARLGGTEVPLPLK